MNLRARLILHQVFYFLLVVFSVLCAVHTTHHDLDFHVYYKLGLRVLAHDTDFYNLARDKGWTFRYGPSFPFLVAPFALLSLPSAKLIWGIFSALAFIAAWFCCEDTLVRRFGEGIRLPGVRLLTLAMMLDPVLRNADQGNVNTLAFLSMVAAVALSDRNKDFSAALILGFGTMMKVYPGGIIVYFLFARKWRAFLASSFATFFWIFMLPALVYGPKEMLRQILAWITVLGDTGHYDYLEYINQAPNAVFWRVFGDPTIAKILSALLIFVVLAGYATWMKRRSTQQTEPLILVASIALPFFVLTCVYIEYLVVLMPLLMTANFLLLTKRFSRAQTAVYLLRFAGVHLAVLALIGRTANEVMAFYGNCLWGLIVLLILLAQSLGSRAQSKV